MARPVTYTWTLPTTTYVAPLQTLAAAGPMRLNSPEVFFAQQARHVTLTSANNLAGVNFTITGKGTAPYGGTIVEVIAGPNANTVVSVNLFTEVYSITTSAVAAAVSAGIGLNGILGPYTYDFHDNNANLGVSVQVTNAITYSLFVTLGDITALPAPAAFNPVVAMTGANNNQMANVVQPMTYAWFTIVTVDPTASIKAIFIQQGLHS